MKVYRNILILLLLLGTMHCNLEVGNPDSDGESIGRRSALSSISLHLSASESCASTAAPCAALPVKFASGDSGYTFEMTEARILLQGLTLEPYAAQQITTEVDLLSGATVALEQTLDAAAITAGSLLFDANRALDAKTYSIAGNLIFSNGMTRYGVPLSLSYCDSLVAQSSTEPGSLLSGFTFDAATWFDFSAATGNLTQLFNNLASGACTDRLSRSCLQYRSTLSRLVADGIARSLKATGRVERAPMRIR